MVGIGERELAILSHLMYYSDLSNEPMGSTVGELTEKLAQYVEDESYPFNGMGMGREETRRFIEEINNSSDTLKNLTVGASENTGTFYATCFVDPETGEALVAFEGTQGQYSTWYDNFEGGYISDTELQQKAAEFVENKCRDYSNLTVTGHSKGGNLAQYVTVICEDKVDHCVSFDGQGFGEDFLTKYHDQIERNRGKIKSIAAYNDYVNILLTPVAGEIIYVKNDESTFPNGHYSLNLLLYNDFDDQGNFTSIVLQDGMIVGLKNLINGYIEKNTSTGNDYKNTLLFWFTGNVVASVLTDGPKDREEQISMLDALWRDFSNENERYLEKFSRLTKAQSSRGMAEFAIDLDQCRNLVGELSRGIDALQIQLREIHDIRKNLDLSVRILAYSNYEMRRAEVMLQNRITETNRLRNVLNQSIVYYRRGDEPLSLSHS
ncbi:MAG: DUF2974 domain-containing protein [Clostridia bacterium]|nr:DUF2974 domain-containing protein [Clostridia bacterium]NCC44106.1 DUF2974 domain-containing protein [Clostridia bacterium]